MLYYIYYIDIIFIILILFYYIILIPNPVSAACFSKANNQETKVGERKGGLFNSQQPEKMADKCHKDHLIRREKEE